MSLSPRLAEKLEGLTRRLTACERVVVAFSGGVDSTLLAKVARDALGRGAALAATADSPSMAREELAQAVALARRLDLEHLVIATREVERPDYRANTGARCYVCKHVLFGELEELAAARGARAVLYGVLADDRLEERPGHRAALEHGVRAPLQEAGIEKWEVRELARHFGLPNWDKPQDACLSSRIPHGQDVTEEKLRQVEAAEALLRARGFRHVRVRHLGFHARIEVGPSEVSRFEDAALRLGIVNGFLAAGFRTVAVDRAGYRPGGADARQTDEWVLQAGVPATGEVSRCGA